MLQKLNLLLIVLLLSVSIGIHAQTPFIVGGGFPVLNNTDYWDWVPKIAGDNNTIFRKIEFSGFSVSVETPYKTDVAFYFSHYLQYNGIFLDTPDNDFVSLLGYSFLINFNILHFESDKLTISLGPKTEVYYNYDTMGTWFGGGIEKRIPFFFVLKKHSLFYVVDNLLKVSYSKSFKKLIFGIEFSVNASDMIELAIALDHHRELYPLVRDPTYYPNLTFFFGPKF